MKKGRRRAQESLNQAIDDLLGGDDVDVLVQPKSKFGGKDASSFGKKHNPSSSPKKTLSSDASPKDFYSSLSAIAGHDVLEENDEEEIEVDPEDAANIAKSLADMDDLESDLFGSFTSKKSNQKLKGGSPFPDSKQKKKKTEPTDFDEDDPLAGLGLSDDEDILSSKSKPKRPELSRRLSQTSSKGKVDPNISAPNAQNSSLSPVRSPSFDKEDPFLATDPRPRSGSGDRKVKRMNSWDDPSIGTQSESEITPRSRSGSGGQQAKITRKGSKKKKVNPSLPNMEKNSDQNREDSIDMPDSGMTGGQTDTRELAKGKDKNQSAKQVDDIFADEDDLPGLSDDESSSPKKRPTKKQVEDAEPTRKAASALDDLLGESSKVKESKSRKPTFLEQMMSKSTTKRNSFDADSPITSPRDKNVTFGGYSPSVGGANERPITAPSRRSVRFADELGFDELDFSLNDSRPSTAPESGQTKKPNRLKDATIGSSFEEENTDISLDLSTSEFKRPSTPTLKTAGGRLAKDKLQGKKETREGTEKSSGSTKISSPRRTPQNLTKRSRDATTDVKKKAQDDWLGLDDTLAPLADKHNAKSAEAATFDVKSDDKNTMESLSRQVSQDDWLGLSDEPAIDTQEVKSQMVNEGQSRQLNETSENKKKKGRSLAPADDELFPWETAGSLERQRRRNRRFEDSKVQLDETSVVSSREPVTHSTPKENLVPKNSRNEANTVTAKQADSGNSPLNEKQPQQQRKLAPGDYMAIGTSSINIDSSKVITESSSQALEPERVNYPASNPQVPRMGEQRPILNQEHIRFASSGANATSDSSQSVQNQNALLAQILADQHAAAISHRSINDQSTRLVTNVKSFDSSLLAEPIEKSSADKLLQQHVISEYEIVKRKNENELKSLEAELRTLYSKLSEAEGSRVKAELESSKKIQDLEEKVRKLEIEKEHFNSSQDMLKRRHSDELKAIESSHKMRFQILEDTYQRREVQLKEENDFVVKQFNERLKAVETEKNEIVAANNERRVVVEKNRDLDIERVKSLHKKAIEDLKKDYEDQLERLRLLKEQEVAAASSMFSQTKSLQTLIQQVQNSTNEVDRMQKRIDLSHKDNLNDREQSLRVRDEYLKSMEEKLQRQEIESSEERSRLQRLIAKLEMQLREQGRQLEQDRWKVSQDENRIKSMQDALEEERKYTLQKLNNERQIIDKSRDELMSEQRRILAECYEERRIVTAEKTNLENIQRKYNRESLDKELAALNDREQEISKGEERLKREIQVLEQSFKNVSEDKQKLQEFAKLVQDKSKEVENLSKDAMKIQQEGIESMGHAHALKIEIANTSALLEDRAVLLDQQERQLSERLASFEMAKTQFEVSKGNLRCSQCQRSIAEAPLTPVPVQTMMEGSNQIPVGSGISILDQQQQQHKESSSVSPPASVMSSGNISASSFVETRAQKDNASHLQPPDIVLGSLNFNRTVRKWSADKEQDEEFFEEEGKYLNEIQRKREARLASVT